MFKVLGFLVTGILSGYLLRRVSVLQELEKTITLTVWAMLFVFGLSIGLNRELIAHLGQFGGQAAVLALAGVAGSLLASYVAFRWIFRQKGGSGL